jgi:adenine/guanine phosphoribosyltransferase-like PRPP-binding protein
MGPKFIRTLFSQVSAFSSVDDVLLTGGAANAVARIMERWEANDLSFVIEPDSLKGREKLLG